MFKGDFMKNLNMDKSFDFLEIFFYFLLNRNFKKNFPYKKKQIFLSKILNYFSQKFFFIEKNFSFDFLKK